jgi:hypothetical protein
MTIIPLVSLSVGEPLNPSLVLPGQPTVIDKDEGQRLIERAFARLAPHDQPVSSNAGSTHTDQLDAIVDAIAELPSNAYGKDGKPKVSAIQSIIEVEITASQRDEAWLVFQQLSKA